MYVKNISFSNKTYETKANNYIKNYLITYCPIQYFLTQLKNENKKRFINEMTNQKLKIVYVVKLDTFLFKMSRVRFWAIEELGKHENVNLFITGKNWYNFDNNISLQDNINNLSIKPDFIIWYKPLEHSFVPLNIPTCIHYNEMWDISHTTQEIINSQSDLIICHHKNDYIRYKDLFEHDVNKIFIYNPHHAKPDIFYDQKLDKHIDILISGVTTFKHYPFKNRLLCIILKYKDTLLKDFNIVHYKHPGYNNEESYSNINQINYAKIINQSKICISCTSKYKYRLGKYIEIPMCGSVICGDIPYEDVESFKNMIIEVNPNMNDLEIVNKLIYYLKNPKLLKEKRDYGLSWAKKYTTTNYVKKMYYTLSKYKYEPIKIINPKIFIISDEIRDNHPEFNNQKWICDILKEEFINTYPHITTKNAKEATHIWYLAPWNYKYKPHDFKNINEWYLFIKNKKVIATIHHIDEDKYKLGEHTNMFNFLNEYCNYIQAICEPTYNYLLKLKLPQSIIKKNLWYNENIFYPIKNNSELRNKYNLKFEDYIIGSFQKDTEGNSLKDKTFQPKLSKGPDIFINIVKDINKTKPVHIILTGLRREYLIQELNANHIPFTYFNMLTLEEINELYNCLDLYIVSSRYEGGPRSIFEAGATKTPIISTKVGIAEDILPKESLYDMHNYITYKEAKPNVDELYKNIQILNSKTQIREIKNYLLSI